MWHICRLTDDIAFRFFAKHYGIPCGYDNRNSRERNKNALVLTKNLSLLGAQIDQRICMRFF